MRLFFSIIFLSLFTSCLTIEYTSNGAIPTEVYSNDFRTQKASIEGSREFYVWGMVPKKHTVEIDREVLNEGFISIKHVTVEEYQTWGDFIASLCTFGLYIGKSYRISGLVTKKER